MSLWILVLMAISLCYTVAVIVILFFLVYYVFVYKGPMIEIADDDPELRWLRGED